MPNLLFQGHSVNEHLSNFQNSRVLDYLPFLSKVPFRGEAPAVRKIIISITRGK